jgi:hypothetical protein
VVVKPRDSPKVETVVSLRKDRLGSVDVVFMVRVAGYGLRVTGCELRVTGYGFDASCKYLILILNSQD